MRLMILFLCLIYQPVSFGADLCALFEEKDGVTCTKNKDPIKHQKYCMQGGKPKHEAYFFKDELCKFGMKGCTFVPAERIEVFCDEKRVSDCYSNKKWMSRNQYFTLRPDLEIVNVGYSIKVKSGIKTEMICAYYK